MVASGAAALIASRLELSKRATSESASACFPNVLDFCTRQFESAECITGGTPGGAGTHKGHTGHAVTHLPVAFDLETRKSLDLGQPCLLCVRSERSWLDFSDVWSLSHRANYKLENHATARLGRMAMGMAHAAHVRLYVCQVRGGHDVCPESGTQWPIPITRVNARNTFAIRGRLVRGLGPPPRGDPSASPPAGSGVLAARTRARPRTVFDHVRNSTTYGIRPRTA